MSRNSFKDLEKINIQGRANNGAEMHKKNIRANINLFSFVSNIIELYIPRAGGVIKYFDPSSPDNIDKRSKKYPNK